MRYPAPEKLEIIRLVEQSHLPVRATLDCPSSDDLGHSAVFRSGGSGPSGVRG